MKLSKRDVEKLAQLAKIELSQEEQKALVKELSAVLDFVEVLKSAPTEDVKPTSQVTGLEDVLRKDEANYNFAQGDMTTTMPTTQDGYCKVRAVFKEDKRDH